MKKRPVTAEEVFTPQWPEGLDNSHVFAQVDCDDKGRDGGCV